MGISSWEDFKIEADTLFDQEKIVVVEKKKFKCNGCRGTGKWSHPTNRFDTRKCFACNGKGFFLSSEADRRKAKKARVVKKQEQKRDNLNACIELYGEEVVKHIYRGMVEASTNNNFLESLYESMGKYGSLTEKQLAAVHKGMEKKVDRAQQKAKPAAFVDFTIIREKLQTAKNNDVRYAKFRAGDNYVFNLAPESGKNPNCVYVKHGDNYLGKITAEGEFFGYNVPEEHINNLEAIAKDPLEGAKAYGQRFGNCGMCGRGLTNHASIDAGVGPICKEKFGL